MAKLYSVSLSDAERLLLRQTLKDTHTSPRKATQVRILLKADAGLERPEWNDIKIAEAFEVSVQTVERLRKRAMTAGWLNMAEIELAILSGQCLDRRIPSIERLRREIAAWEGDRNETATAVNWRFTTADARIKLKHLYPVH